MSCASPPQKSTRAPMSGATSQISSSSRPEGSSTASGRAIEHLMQRGCDRRSAARTRRGVRGHRPFSPHGVPRLLALRRHPAVALDIAGSFECGAGLHQPRNRDEHGARSTASRLGAGIRGRHMSDRAPSRVRSSDRRQQPPVRLERLTCRMSAYVQIGHRDVCEQHIGPERSSDRQAAAADP